MRLKKPIAKLKSTEKYIGARKSDLSKIKKTKKKK